VRSLVYVARDLPGEALSRLSASHEIVRGGTEGFDEAALSTVEGDLEALVVTVRERVDDARLRRLPRLRVVANVAVGVDNIDLDACRTRGVVVTNTPNVLTEATADAAFGLLLAAARRIAEGDRLVRSGAFTGWTPTHMLGVPVFGRTLGVIGLGRIGQAVARRARGFGMHVLYAGRARLPETVERALGATFVDVDALFEESDFVSLHCPLTPETRKLVSAARLARMKPTAVLVNTARGAVVDEEALADALARGRIAAAGLDVYEDEPRVNAKLLTLDNVVLAPHLGSADVPTREAMASLAVDNVLAVLGGRPAKTPVV
jgi:glyoxylate reductase